MAHFIPLFESRLIYKAPSLLSNRPTLEKERERMIFIHGTDMSIQLSTASKDVIQWPNVKRANILIQEQQPLPPELETETVEGLAG